MKVEKKIVSNLNKCYAMSQLTYKGENCFLVAAEKQDPCYLFTEDGTLLDTVWEQPGGVMTMTQRQRLLPGHPPVLFPQRLRQCQDRHC